MARGGGAVLVGETCFCLPDTEVFHVPDHFCFTTDRESGSKYEKYRHLTHILSLPRPEYIFIIS